MTAVRPSPRSPRPSRGWRPAVARSLLLALLLLPAAALPAQQGGVHYMHHSTSVPGAIGQWQLRRGGPLPGYFQPVEIRAPQGALVSLAQGPAFDAPEAAPRRVGLLIGPVYRLQVTNIPFREGEEVFPTIELIDRIYPPPGLLLRFPIPVELTLEDLNLALDGRLVTRVIYLEDPRHALPAPQGADTQPWFDVAPGVNPLQAADELGKPVAILRIGGRVPGAEGPDSTFLFGSPPYQPFAVDPGEVVVAAAERKPNQTTREALLMSGELREPSRRLR